MSNRSYLSKYLKPLSDVKSESKRLARCKEGFVAPMTAKKFREICGESVSDEQFEHLYLCRQVPRKGQPFATSFDNLAEDDICFIYYLESAVRYFVVSISSIAKGILNRCDNEWTGIYYPESALHLLAYVCDAIDADVDLDESRGYDYTGMTRAKTYSYALIDTIKDGFPFDYIQLSKDTQEQLFSSTYEEEIEDDEVDSKSELPDELTVYAWCKHSPSNCCYWENKLGYLEFASTYESHNAKLYSATVTKQDIYAVERIGWSDPMTAVLIDPSKLKNVKHEPELEAKLISEFEAKADNEVFRRAPNFRITYEAFY